MSINQSFEEITDDIDYVGDTRKTLPLYGPGGNPSDALDTLNTSSSIFSTNNELLSAKFKRPKGKYLATKLSSREEYSKTSAYLNEHIFVPHVTIQSKTTKTKKTKYLEKLELSKVGDRFRGNADHLLQALACGEGAQAPHPKGLAD